MEEDKGHKLPIMFSIIQSALLLVTLAMLGIFVGTKEIFFSYLTLIPMILILGINVLRHFLGLNLFLVRRDIKYQNIMLYSQILGFFGLFLLFFGHFLLGIFLTTIVLVVIPVLRYEIWDIFVDAKELQRNDLKMKLIKFFAFFIGIFILLSFLGLVGFSFFSAIVLWLLASSTLGYKSMEFHKYSILQEGLDEEKKTRFKLSKFILVAFSFGSISANSIEKSILSTPTYIIIFLSPFIGGPLVIYYIYLYIKNENIKI